MYVTNTTTDKISADFRCQAHGVPANYIYRVWLHNWPGHWMYLRYFDGSESLRLDWLTYQDSGYYTCMVTNGVQASRNPGAGMGRAYLLVEGTRPYGFKNVKQHNYNIYWVFCTTLIISFVSDQNKADIATNIHVSLPNAFHDDPMGFTKNGVKLVRKLGCQF